MIRNLVRGAVAMALIFVLPLASKAQLAGTKNIPGDYADLATAVTALNTVGVGTGGVTINLLAGNPQAAPVGGYLLGSAVLNGSLSATKTITINGNSNTVTAFTGTGTTDAIFTLAGVDYTTIKQLHLSENALNLTATSRMEWGYNFVKLNGNAPFDGCQNNSIQSCNISLNAANLPSCGIRLAHTIAGNTTILATTGVTMADANSNNTFLGNRISNADTAMSFRGIPLAGFYDYNNVIGGSTPISGNSITLGGSTSTLVAGIYTAYDSVITLQNNQFDISPLQSIATTTMAMYATGMGRGDMTLRGNSFNISWAPAGTAFAGTIYAVRNDNGANTATPLAHCDPAAKFIFTGNTMTGTDTLATTGTLYGLYHNYAYFNVDSVCNNAFSNITWSSNAKTGSGNLLCIFYNQGGRPYTTTNNNTFTNIYKLGANNNSTFTCLDNSSNQASTGLINCMYNLVQNCTSNGSTKGIYTGGGVFLNNAQIVMVKYNKVDNVVVNSSTTTTGGALWGFYVANGAKGSDIAYDTVTGCRTNAGPLNAIYKSAYADIHNCYIANDTTATNFVNAITHIGGYNNSVYNNRISGLVVTGAATFNSGIYGINANGGLGFCNIYNNSITDYSTPQLASFNGVYGISVGTNNYTSKFNIYHNTIKISANTAGNNFGVAGIYLNDKTTGVDLRNNIVNISSTPKGQGIVAALCKNPGMLTAAATLTTNSGNNIYYINPAGNCYYFAEGFSIAYTIAFGPLNDPNFNNPCLSTYKAWMGTKEQTSYNENNLSALTGYTGLYIPTGLTLAKSGASPVSVTNTDLLGVVRPTPGDIGALQVINGVKEDHYPPVITYTPLPATTVCANVAPTLTATIIDGSSVNTTTAAPRLYFRKKTENDAFGTVNTAAFNGWKYVTGVNTSGNQFTFTPNYSLLTAPLASGDSIVYFVIAQDQVVPANVSANAVAFANGYCLTSVNLTAAAGPTNPAFPKNYYTILTPVTAALSPAVGTICGGIPVMITATGTATAPTVANLGTDTTTNLNNDDNSPINGQQYNHRHQMIFKASELAAQGMTAGVSISSVALNVAFSFGVTFMDSMNVAMGLTAASKYSATTPGGGWVATTQVFRGAVSVADGMNTYVLNTPFVWDGVSNLAIDFVARKNSPLWSTGVYNTNTTDSMNQYYNDFGNVGAPLPYDSVLSRSVYNAVNSFQSPMRPNVTLIYNAPKPKHWIPVTGLFKNPALTIPMTASDTNSVVYAAPVAMTSYSVVSVLPGCNSAPSNPSVITPITGFANVSPSGNVSRCDSVILHAPSAGNVTYQWQRNGVTITGATDSIYRATTPGTYRVYIVSVGCSDTALVPAVVTINPSPVATVTSNGTTGCDSLWLNANTGAGLTYQWQMNSANITSATLNAYKVVATGAYRVVETSPAGCTDTSATIAATINPSPAPIIMVNGNILSTSAPYPTYQWYRNGVLIAGATNSTYLATRDGAYTVVVTGGNGCTGTSGPAQLAGNGVTGLHGVNGISIYPNPAQDVVFVKYDKNVNIVIRDVVGKLVRQQADAKSITIEDIANGVYTITLTDAQGNILLTEKLLK